MNECVWSVGEIMIVRERKITQGKTLFQCNSVHHKSHMYWRIARVRMDSEEDTLLATPVRSSQVDDTP
jgi:hypothetical protein